MINAFAKLDHQRKLNDLHLRSMTNTDRKKPRLAPIPGRGSKPRPMGRMRNPPIQTPSLITYAADKTPSVDIPRMETMTEKDLKTELSLKMVSVRSHISTKKTYKKYKMKYGWKALTILAKAVGFEIPFGTTDRRVIINDIVKHAALYVPGWTTHTSADHALSGRKTQREKLSG